MHQRLQVLLSEDGEEPPPAGPAGAAQHGQGCRPVGPGLRGADLGGQGRWVWTLPLLTALPCLHKAQDTFICTAPQQDSFKRDSSAETLHSSYIFLVFLHVW